MDRYNQIDTFSRYSKVSRETIKKLNYYEKLLIRANKNLNLVGNSTIDHIWYRHFLDSVQVIDFIDKNDKTLIDVGTGAGFPGLVSSDEGVGSVEMLKGSKVGGRGGDMLSPDRFPTGSTVGSGTEGMAASGVSFASSVPEASFSEAGISDATDSTVAGTDGVTFSISDIILL